MVKAEWYCPRCKLYIDNPSPVNIAGWPLPIGENAQTSCSECGYAPLLKFEHANKKELEKLVNIIKG